MDMNYFLNETVINATNFTTTELLPEYFWALIRFLKMFSIVTQLFIMVSMGSIISVEEIVSHLKRPTSVVIAHISQFFAMPLCSFGIINLLQLSPEASLAALILACCPGGSISNLVTYFCDGDVPLSITLTTISTTLALGFMPFNLWIYARRWTDNQTFEIPYVGVVITLALILIPLIIGMLIKKYLPNVAVIVNKIGSLAGVLFILVSTVIQNVLQSKSFTGSRWKSWIIAGAIPTGGFIAGLFMSMISKRSSKHIKTIAIETGMQSISLTITVLLTSFPQNLQNEMTHLPTVCGVITVVAGICLAVSIKIHNRCYRKTIPITILNKQVVSTLTK